MSKEIKHNSSGIVVKLWNVSASNGTSSDKVENGLNNSINYIINDEKTSATLSESIKLDEANDIKNEIAYVTNDLKTMKGQYVAGQRIIDLEHASEEMLSVKEHFAKTDGRVAKHGIISLPENESSPENAGKLMLLCRDMLNTIYAGHQAVYAVHLNTDNLHVHFIINSVSTSGKKIHEDNTFTRNVLHPCVNELARKYGFTPNLIWEEPRKTDTLSYPERKMYLRDVIDKTIEKSYDFNDFIDNLKEQGLTVNVGKFMSLKTEDMPKAMRTQSLGSRYAIENIESRILHKHDKFSNLSVKQYAKELGTESVKSTIKPMKKYKDMNDKEKKEIIKQLKLGKNPWRDYYEKNWQISRIQATNQRMDKIVALVSTYSKNNNIDEAMENIKVLQTSVASERKEIKKQMQEHKTVIDIYKAMQKIEKQAYLYEYSNCNEYQKEYEKYQEYVERLKNYDKTPNEVAEFLIDCENNLYYLKSQQHELVNQYRILNSYLSDGLNRAKEYGEKNSLATTLDFSKDVENAKTLGFTVNKEKYIAIKNSNVFIHMDLSAYIPEGSKRIEQNVTINIVNADAEIVKSISIKDTPNFYQEFNGILAKFDNRECYELNSMSDAIDYAERQEEQNQEQKEQEKTRAKAR